MTPAATITPNVSRETLELLTEFHGLLEQWNPKINLVSKSSMLDVWTRHIWDSAQLMDYGSGARHWVDIGTGGGFPGLVVAILSKEIQPVRRFTLVESDKRKSAFLRTVIRHLNLSAEVISDRVELINRLDGDVVSARALASLGHLLDYAEQHLAPGGTALFLKGETWEKEVEAARNSWSFQLNVHKSKTNPEAAILAVKEITRV